MKNIEKGREGENFVNDELKKQGYEIITRNFRCKIGEIDIIYRRNGYIVFGEIKTRYSNNFGIPCEAVGYKKQQKIKKVALYYMQTNKLFNNFFTFDVIEVIYDYNYLNYKLSIIKDAF